MLQASKASLGFNGIKIYSLSLLLFPILTPTIQGREVFMPRMLCTNTRCVLTGHPKSLEGDTPQTAGPVRETQALVTKAPASGPLTQMDSARDRGFHPPPSTICTQLCPPTGSAGTRTSHCSAPVLAWPPLEQPRRPAPNNQPGSRSAFLSYFRSTPPGLLWGAGDSNFSPGLAKLAGPCDLPSRQQREKFSEISSPLMEKVCLINN